MKIHTTLRVAGQRLLLWDGVTGFVALNSRGMHIHAPEEEVKIEWADGESEYVALKDFEDEGIIFGKGVMPLPK